MEEQESLPNHFGTLSARPIAGKPNQEVVRCRCKHYISVQIVSSSCAKWDELHKHSASAIWG